MDCPKNQLKDQMMRQDQKEEAGLKGVSAKKMDANQGNFEAAVKPDSAKIASRKLTCSTVERWKTQDLVLYEAGSWLTYDSEKTKRGHHCAALKCTERYVVSLNLWLKTDLSSQEPLLMAQPTLNLQTW